MSCVHNLHTYKCEVFNMYICMGTCFYIYVLMCNHMHSCVSSCVTHFVCLCTSYMFFDAAVNTQFICMYTHVYTFFNGYAFHQCVSIYGTVSPNVICPLALILCVYIQSVELII